ncbi:MAG TPA: bifunctional nuclease domain-containing protein [Solirubrobacteraceae bacterium]|nr:bifunctional nuclease domain-containing protein [Solirubrobacteraceae bacterium]
MLVERHYPVLLSSCRRAVRDTELAQDAAQQAVLTAMLGLHRLRDEDRFAAWLIGTGLNVCRTLIGARVRMVPSRQTMIDHTNAVKPMALECDPQHQSETTELVTNVHAAIQQLPAGQRQAVVLFYLAGLTHAEIAQELGTRPGAVKTRLHKARHSLRTPLEPLWKEHFAMPTKDLTLVPVRIADLRRTAATKPEPLRHVVFLAELNGDRRMPIWIGATEATALAVILESVELPRPGPYHFAASLLHAAGGELREVRIVKLTDSVFFAQVVLAGGTAVDARPSDALTLATLTGSPIYIAEDVLRQADERQPQLGDLVRDAQQATDDATTLADEARARISATIAAREAE